MKSTITIGGIWEHREKGSQGEVVAVHENMVQLSVKGEANPRIMSESSLRKNYRMIASAAAKVTEPEPIKTAPKASVTDKATTKPASTEQPTGDGKKARAPGGRVKLADGKIIAGSSFITETCGLTREDTYKVDSPIRWLLKEAGTKLLASKGASIVYGETITK